MCPQNEASVKAPENSEFYRRNLRLTVDAVEVDDRVIKTQKMMPCSGFQKTVE